MTQQGKGQSFKNFGELQAQQAGQQGSQPQSRAGGVAPAGLPNRPAATGGTPSGSGARGDGLPEGYLKGGYYNDEKQLRPEVVTSWAWQIAQLLANGNMKVSQLRNFFGTLRLAEQRQRSGTPFGALKAHVARLDPLAHVAVGRNVAPAVFTAFVARNVEQAQKDEASFKAFVYHFEAIVCYVTFLRPS